MLFSVPLCNKAPPHVNLGIWNHCVDLTLQVLWNHILGYALVSEEVPANGRLATPTMNNGQLVLVRRGAAFFAGSTHIIQPDILCLNGVIHLARDVILDPRRY